MDKKVLRRKKIKYTIRKKIAGTATKPRLSVFRSNKEIYAQLIDDSTGTTIASASSRDKGFSGSGTKVEKAHEVGKLIAELGKKAGIDTCVFDRGGYLYHGRVKSLADGAREAGLNF